MPRSTARRRNCMPVARHSSGIRVRDVSEGTKPLTCLSASRKRCANFLKGLVLRVSAITRRERQRVMAVYSILRSTSRSSGRPRSCAAWIRAFLLASSFGVPASYWFCHLSDMRFAQPLATSVDEKKLTMIMSLNSRPFASRMPSTIGLNDPSFPASPLQFLSPFSRSTASSSRVITMIPWSISICRRSASMPGSPGPAS
mmetsp:Transcript_65313/g.181091  ORF Transcript_65313/g.181091 Transcript_65313/m.181091 type:complete len:200 (-) Transcript_65313:158-757(-)